MLHSCVWKLTGFGHSDFILFHIVWSSIRLGPAYSHGNFRILQWLQDCSMSGQTPIWKLFQSFIIVVVNQGQYPLPLRDVWQCLETHFLMGIVWRLLLACVGKDQRYCYISYNDQYSPLQQRIIQSKMWTVMRSGNPDQFGSHLLISH